MKAPRVLMPRWRCQATEHKATNSFYTHYIMMNIFALTNFAACTVQAESRITGKLKEWVMIDHNGC